MAKKSKGYVGCINKLPLILKVILALPIIDGIVYGIYRICKGKLLIGILWIFIGAIIGWIIDIICILVNGKPTVLA